MSRRQSARSLTRATNGELRPISSFSRATSAGFLGRDHAGTGMVLDGSQDSAVGNPLREMETAMTGNPEVLKAVKISLQQQVGGHCSICDARTWAPHAEANKALVLGDAAHIAAASPGGPRYDRSMSDVDRSAAENLIWLCLRCHREVDRNSSPFSREWLVQKKAEALRAAEEEASGASMSRDQGYECPFCCSFAVGAQRICTGCGAEILRGLTDAESGTIVLALVFLPPLATHAILSWLHAHIYAGIPDGFLPASSWCWWSAYSLVVIAFVCGILQLLRHHELPVRFGRRPAAQSPGEIPGLTLLPAKPISRRRGAAR